MIKVAREKHTYEPEMKRNISEENNTLDDITPLDTSADDRAIVTSTKNGKECIIYGLTTAPALSTEDRLAVEHHGCTEQHDLERE